MAAHIGANDEPHSEDAGDQMVLLLPGFRASIGDIIRHLDEASNGEFPDFQTTLAHQTATGTTPKLAPRPAKGQILDWWARSDWRAFSEKMAKRAEEIQNIRCQDGGLLHGSEMAALCHHCPLPDVGVDRLRN